MQHIMAKQSRGTCLFCNYESTKGSMSKHLSTCPKRLEAQDNANGAGKSETLLQLRVQDDYFKDFWLDIEMRGSATLKDLDFYLRGIWLECCGHMSQFYLGQRYGTEVAMKNPVATAFQKAPSLYYIYDFGTSSELTITGVNIREGAPLTQKPLVLLSRNRMPDVVCDMCAQPATHQCNECMVEEGEWAIFCLKCREEHLHQDNYGYTTIVNSPRLGMCGYEGDALPPY
jgi:hypothetical protein